MKMIELLKSSGKECWINQLLGDTVESADQLLGMAVTEPWRLKEDFPGREDLIKLRAIKKELNRREVSYGLGITVDSFVVIFTVSVDGFSYNIVVQMDEAYEVGEYILLDAIKFESPEPAADEI